MSDEHIMLRPYQNEAVTAAKLALASNRDQVQVVSLPTGSGKTMVGLAIATDFLNQNPTGKVLWLAPRVELISQARDRLASSWTSHYSMSQIVDCNRSRAAAAELSQARLIFTTLQTWYSRRDDQSTFASMLANVPLLIVHDECHWASDAELGTALLDRYLISTPILGLSATPRVNPATHRAVYTKSYGELCPEYLAIPLLYKVATGEVREPSITVGDFSGNSLNSLASRESRNRIIVDTFMHGASAGYCNRTIIFACNVAHANELRKLLARQGVAIQAAHSSRSRKQNLDAIESFRMGRVNVLVTVVMLTEGFDVPEIDSIFLTRPTRSADLLAQMVGRGSRKCVGKRDFRIFEFTDSMQRLGDQLYRCSDYISRGQNSGAGIGSPATRHSEPMDIPSFETLDLPGLDGITYAQDQTFGVEIELGSRTGFDNFNDESWQAIAGQLIQTLQRVARLPVRDQPSNYHANNDHTHWRVSYDSSCGWEIVSPILVNASGFAELVRVATAVDELVQSSQTLCANFCTGLHITLATRLDTRERRNGFAARVSRLEPGLFTLVSPSRLFLPIGSWAYVRRKRNFYCAPLREIRQFRARRSFTGRMPFSRYHSVNLTRLGNPYQLLEVRMHNGTTDYRKIVPWIALWMQIFNRSRYDWNGEAEFGRVMPGGNTPIGRWRVDQEDIFQLLRNEGIYLPSSFERILWERRRQLRHSWVRAVPQRVRRWDAAGWYNPVRWETTS